MRPTVEEQLAGTCRILETVVMPALSDPYARTLLAGLIGNLGMLGQAIPAIHGFLREDNGATADLLAMLRAGVSPALRERIDAALAMPAPDGADRAALEACNDALRDLLSQVLLDDTLPDASRQAALKHLSRRAARAPMRYVANTTPAPRNN